MTAVQARLDGVMFEVRAQESLLDACLRSAIQVPFSCRGGVCQTCLLQCTQGDIPPRAQRGLAGDLRDQGYLMACQCLPLGSITLTRPRAADRVTACVLVELDEAGPFAHLRFETARVLPCRPGQHLVLQLGREPFPQLEVTACLPETHTIEALLRYAPGSQRPAWLGPDYIFGFEFDVRGPVDADDDPAQAAADRPPETAAPEPDPDLWEQLGGTLVRAVLEDFYRQVYRDPQLASFFRQVTIDRSIDKQYSFLRQLMTGERVYFGDRPRNAHHWMVITGELFDYRQHLMVTTLQAHGLSAAQIARWTRLELHYRRDIVKSGACPRQLDGRDLPLDGYASERLSAATVCDHCAAEIDAGTEVMYHLRLGHVSCARCAAVMPQKPTSSGVGDASRC
jgi:ferredoxin/truncated hemoglobin YjbI